MNGGNCRKPVERRSRGEQLSFFIVLSLVMSLVPDITATTLGMSVSQAGRRGFEPRLPLHLFNELRGFHLPSGRR